MKLTKLQLMVLVSVITIFPASAFAGNVVKILGGADKSVPKYEETQYNAQLLEFNYQGEVAGAGIVKPTSGNIGKLLVEDIELTMKEKRFSDGAVDTKELGKVRILFSSSLTSVGFLTLLTNEQLKKLENLINRSTFRGVQNDELTPRTLDTKVDHVSKIDNNGEPPRELASDNSKNDGFLNGIKYGISYPFVFWGAEGFVKIPLNEMTGSFTFGYISTLVCVLLIVGSIFMSKNSK